MTEPAKDDPSRSRTREGSERESYAIDFSSSPQEPVPVPVLQKLEPLQPAAELHRNLWPAHNPATPNASLPSDAGYPVATLRPHQRGPQLHESLPPAPPPDTPDVEHQSREEPDSLPSTISETQQQQQIPSVQVQPSPSHSVQSMTPGIPRARPWPAAMLYGNIKGLRSPGDRAKAYAKAINELARAESGLREWCEASSKSSMLLVLYSGVSAYGHLQSSRRTDHRLNVPSRSRQSTVWAYDPVRPLSYPSQRERETSLPRPSSQCEPTRTPPVKSRHA